VQRRYDHALVKIRHAVGKGWVSQKVDNGPRPRRQLKVLLVNQYFPPDASATAAIFESVLGAFAEAGHDTTVLCGRPSYRPSQRMPWRPLARETIGRMRVERVGSTAFELSRIACRLANYASFLALASGRVLVGKRPDIVIAGSDPPLAVIVAHLAARGRPVVYYLQDLHPAAAVVAGWIKPGPLASIWAGAHAWALRRCSQVICVGERMAARVADEGVDPERITVVPNGAPPPGKADDPELVRRLRAEASFVIVHAGNIGIAGAWETIVGASKLASDDVKFVLVGSGALRGYALEQGLRVEPFSPNVANVMAAGDLQLVTQRRGMDGLVVPSKLYTVLAHGRPVFAVVPETSEVASLVERHGCGVVADPDDPTDVAEKLERLRADPEALATMSLRAQEVGREYLRPAVYRPIVRLVEELAAGGYPRPFVEPVGSQGPKP
jgi:colanic acid biosynthesis glycosyl transferase WcaI